MLESGHRMRELRGEIGLIFVKDPDPNDGLKITGYSLLEALRQVCLREGDAHVEKRIRATQAAWAQSFEMHGKDRVTPLFCMTCSPDQGRNLAKWECMLCGIVACVFCSDHHDCSEDDDGDA